MPRNLPILMAAAVAAATLAAASAALGAWPHTPTSNLGVCTATGNQQGAVTTSDGAGGVIVTWQDQRSGGTTDIYAHHVLASGVLDPAWPASGLAVCTAANYQILPVIASDGAGGAIIAWMDYRSGGLEADLYAQRVLAAGTVDPAWPVDGRAVCTALFDSYNPSILADGAGGAILAWSDTRAGGANADLYAHRVLASGAVDPAWPANGRAVCTAANDQNWPAMVSDGAGGVILAWQDSRVGGFFDIYAHHVLPGGSLDGGWPVNGLAVCAATNSQDFAKLVADGAGGAIVTWQDYRSGGNYDVYAQHIFASGYVDGMWPVDGLAVCALANSQNSPSIASDGAGGAIVTWLDRRGGVTADVYAQRLLISGMADPGWPVDGRALCTAANEQYAPVLVEDGAGGAIVTWYDARSGDSNPDIYAHHVLASGAADPLWPANGRALCTATATQQYPVIATDGNGGAIVTWVDLRGAGFDIYAQRVARFGVLGTPEPEIASVRDVPNDQGGKVKLSWDASWLDTDPSAVVDHYWIFRSVPPAAAQAALRGGARLRAKPTNAPASRELFATTDGLQTLYWEFVTSQPAFHIISGYSYLAATTGDSTGAYNPPTMFMVTAWNAAQTQYWSSAPAGGYSVDNLAPATPEPFLGNYAGGATHLHWNPNDEADLSHYRLYRGASAAFVPGPGNLIAAPPDTGHADAGAAGSYYKLSAVDTHGNESGFALLTPAGTASVGDVGAELALALPFPNPSRGDVSFALTLPADGPANLAIYDAAGRRVRSLFAGRLAAGSRTFAWDGRGEAGEPVAGGLYFARLEAAGRVMVRRVVRVE